MKYKRILKLQKKKKKKKKKEKKKKNREAGRKCNILKMYIPAYTCFQYTLMAYTLPSCASRNHTYIILTPLNPTFLQ